MNTSLIYRVLKVETLIKLSMDSHVKGKKSWKILYNHHIFFVHNYHMIRLEAIYV